MIYCAHLNSFSVSGHFKYLKTKIIFSEQYSDTIFPVNTLQKTRDSWVISQYLSDDSKHPAYSVSLPQNFLLWELQYYAVSSAIIVTVK